MSDAPFPLPPAHDPSAPPTDPALPNAAVPTPEPIGVAGSLPFRDSELRQTLDTFKGRGPEAYERALRAAQADGYALPAEHKTALDALPRPDPTRSGDTWPPPAAPGTEAEAFDNSSLAPASSPADYDFRGLAAELPGFSETEYQGAENALRSVMHDMGLPAGIGGSVAKMGVQSANQYQTLDENGRALWALEQRSQLAQMHPDIAATARKVDRLVEAVGDPEAVKIMADAGFFSAAVITLLAAHYDRMALRGKMR